MDPYLQQERRKANAAFLAWLLVLVPSLIALWLWLSLQGVVEMILEVSGISTWSWSAVKLFAFIGMGVIWLASVFIMQHLLYKSAVSGKLVSRMMQLCAPLLGLLACSQAIRFSFGASELSFRSIFPVGLETVLSALMYALYRNGHRRMMTSSDHKDGPPSTRRK